MSVFRSWVLLFFIPFALYAQSTDPNYPTPVDTNEINGTIRARDIGDPRLTSYFYTFDGGQGDIFINVVTRNFSGDIDVFAADALRPLTKMVIYADAERSETGRLIYLRKGERLVLRVEGRTPNDDPAEFRIKFGGSFIAITGQKPEDAPTVARNNSANEPGVKVNSVGTIIAVVPKPQPTPKASAEPPVMDETVAEVVPEADKQEPIKQEEIEAVKTEPKEEPVAKTPPRKKVVVTSDIPTVFGKKSSRTDKAKPSAAERAKAAREKRAEERRKKAEEARIKAEEARIKAEEAKARREEERAKAEEAKTKTDPPSAEPTPNPLASIMLVVELKDGNVIERPMSEVVKFSVDKGILTVTEKGGKVTRYSMITDVAKVTIE